jgi:hypothetical protein
MSYALTTLQAVRNLLADPAHWTQRVMARDANGGYSSPYDEKAVCFCLRGAFARVNDEGCDNWLAMNVVDEALFGAADGDTLHFVAWNDHAARTHADVIAALDKAITIAQERNL